jgi:hypothetical protein
MDPNTPLAGTPFPVWAEMKDGSVRRLTIWGFGTTYQERLTDAREEARRHPDLKDAAVINVRP